LRKSTIIFNYQIVDGHIEFPYSMLLFDKFAVTKSKSKLNVMTGHISHVLKNRKEEQNENEHIYIYILYVDIYIEH
jgi:hypothetical protein